MATQLKKTGPDKKLTDRERTYCLEYVANGFNKKLAAETAGYKSPGVQGSQLYTRTHIRRYIGYLLNKHFEEVGCTAGEVIRQLVFGLTRVASDYVDENGRLLPLSELNERAQACVDGFEQEVTTLYDEGEEVGEKVKTKIKLTPKASYVDMAMKHKDLFSPEVVRNILTIDFDRLTQGPGPDEIVDPYEAELKKLGLEESRDEST